MFKNFCSKNVNDYTKKGDAMLNLRTTMNLLLIFAFSLQLLTSAYANVLGAQTIDPALSSTAPTQPLNSTAAQENGLESNLSAAEQFENSGPISSATAYELPSGWKFAASTPGFAYIIADNPNPGRPATSGYLAVMDLRTKETKTIDTVAFSINRFIDADVVQVDGEAKVIWRKTTLPGISETVSISSFDKTFVRASVTYDVKSGASGISDPINGFKLAGYYKGAHVSGNRVNFSFTSGESISYQWPANSNQITVTANTTVPGKYSVITFECTDVPRKSQIQNVAFYSAQRIKVQEITYQYDLTTEQRGALTKAVPPYNQVTTTLYHSNGQPKKITTEKIHPDTLKAFSFDIKNYTASGVMTRWATGSYYSDGKTIDAQLVTTYNAKGKLVSRYACYYNSKGKLIKKIKV